MLSLGTPEEHSLLSANYCSDCHQSVASGFIRLDGLPQGKQRHTHIHEHTQTHTHTEYFITLFCEQGDMPAALLHFHDLRTQRGGRCAYLFF